jgi:hypothetical protein
MRQCHEVFNLRFFHQQSKLFSDLGFPSAELFVIFENSPLYIQWESVLPLQNEVGSIILPLNIAVESRDSPLHNVAENPEMNYKKKLPPA